jgi:hypothetical protein
MLIVHAPPIFWHHVHSKKDHQRPSILAHSSSRTRENTNKSLQGMKQNQNQHENTQGNHNDCPEQQQSERRQENKGWREDVEHGEEPKLTILLSRTQHHQRRDGAWSCCPLLAACITLSYELLYEFASFAIAMMFNCLTPLSLSLSLSLSFQKLD